MTRLPDQPTREERTYKCTFNTFAAALDWADGYNLDNRVVQSLVVVQGTSAVENRDGQIEYIPTFEATMMVKMKDPA